jgi:hypothetical protein
LGTTSDLVVEHPDINSNSLEKLKDATLEERMRREEVGETDCDAIRQKAYVMPEVDENLVGFKIEYCFTYSDDDGTPYDAWCDGVVVEKVINEKNRMVLIRWNEKKVHEGDQLVPRHKLAIQSWNPKKQWRGMERVFWGP